MMRRQKRVNSRGDGSEKEDRSEIKQKENEKNCRVEDALEQKKMRAGRKILCIMHARVCRTHK